MDAGRRCGGVAGLLTGGLAWLVGRPTAHADPTGPRVRTGTVQVAVRRWPRVRRLLRRHLDPARTTDVALTGASLVVVAALLAVGVLLIMIRTHSGLAKWDRGAAEWGAGHATATSTSILKVLTQLGGTVVGVGVGSSSPSWRLFAPADAVVGSSSPSSLASPHRHVTKRLVDAPGPTSIARQPGPSFPSGHARRRRRSAPLSRWCCSGTVVPTRHRRRRAVGIAGPCRDPGPSRRPLAQRRDRRSLVGWAGRGVPIARWAPPPLRRPVEAATEVADARHQPATWVPARRLGAVATGLSRTVSASSRRGRSPCWCRGAQPPASSSG